VPNTFSFNPPAFFAGASHPVTQTDTLTVTLTVNPGQVITGIRIHEVGVRTLGSTQVTGTLFIKDLQDGGFGQLQQSLTITNGAPNGNTKPWAGDAIITGLHFTQGQMLSLSLTNNLLAFSGQRIDKTGVTIEVLPTPGVLGLAGIAAVSMGRRRRLV
jgi:hypothetical protein